MKAKKTKPVRRHDAIQQDCTMPVNAVEQANHVCPSCEGKTFDLLADLPDQVYDGTTIRRQRVRCQTCSQVSIVRNEGTTAAKVEGK